METEGSLEGVVITALVDSTLSVKWGENKLIIIYIYFVDSRQFKIEFMLLKGTLGFFF